MKKRFVLFPLFVAAVSFSVFLRSDGSDHTRTVQILTLVAIGMGLGIALANLLPFSTRNRKTDAKLVACRILLFIQSGCLH